LNVVSDKTAATLIRGAGERPTKGPADRRGRVHSVAL